DEQGAIKIVMTGSASDELPWQRHIRPKAARERLATRFRDPDDPLQLVIVRDMWLTGFDVPCLHTMYLDKPMRGHGLMQTKARVLRHVDALSKAFALAVPHPDALAIRDEVAFFQAVRAGFVKTSTSSGQTSEALDHAIRQIISRAVATEEVVDVFALAGLDK